jgi:glycosyltransferase involved in cell wall biosynthesis
VAKKIIVISAVGLNQGGTLTVARKILAAADKIDTCRIIALVYDKGLYPEYKRVKLISVPFPKKNWMCRIYFEFVSSYKISSRLKPSVWFSLHDITPRTSAIHQFVYCHNATPLYHAGLRDLIFQPTVFVFSLFYRYLYSMNIRANKIVFVQQNCIRDYFRNSYAIEKVSVARPFDYLDEVAPEDRSSYKANKVGQIRLFYPTLPRTFKNVEILIKAAEILNQRGFRRFEIRITLSAADSLYARYLVFNARHVDGIRFIGRLSHEAVFSEYRQSDALVFPSKLESWGLPLSEAKSLGLPVLAANLPYARETLGVYDKVNFFDPDDPYQLADKIIALASGKGFEGSDFSMPTGVPVLNGWDELLACITTHDNPPEPKG